MGFFDVTVLSCLCVTVKELIIFLHKEKLDVSLLLSRAREKYTA